MATVINRANICSIDGKYIIRRRRPFEKWYIFFLLLRDPLKWTAYLFGGSSSMATQRQVHFMCFFFFYLLDFQLNVAITNCSENGLSNFLMFCLNILNGDLFIDCVFSLNMNSISQCFWFWLRWKDVYICLSCSIFMFNVRGSLSDWSFSFIQNVNFSICSTENCY